MVSQYGAKLIINCRTLESLEYNEQCDFPCFALLEQSGLQNLKFIKLNYFKAPEVDTWIKTYAFCKEGDGKKQILTLAQIRSTHKNLDTACQNPLFLYILNKSFYNSENALQTIDNVYDLYDHFVNNTVKGKFYNEARFGNQTLGEMIDHYTEFLTEIATNIAEYSSKFTHFDQKEANKEQKQTDGEDELLLDNNSSLYGIPVSKASSKIKNILAKLFPDQTKFNDVKIDQKLLNCYFFEQREDKWRFRDNNILYFFLSKQIFSSISAAINMFNEDQTIEKTLDLIKEKISTPLHPVVIELLLWKLNNIKDLEKESFVYFIRQLIKDKLILSIPKKSNVSLFDETTIKTDIFLAVLFIQLNEYSYAEIDFFFNRLEAFLKLTNDAQLIFLVRRFFKKAVLTDAQFEDTHLFGYNFDQTVLTNVVFEHCRITAVRKNNSEFNGVSYIDCSISGETEMRAITGNIIFDQCTISSLKITDIKDPLHLIFKNCTIQHLDIFATYKSTIHVELIGCCRIEKIHFQSAIVKNLILKNNIITNIKAEGSKIYFQDAGNIWMSHKGIKSKHSDLFEINEDLD